MSSNKYRWGYCPLCVKNIPHYPVPDSGLAPILKLMTLGFADRLRLGPWFCLHCENKSIYLREERPDALRYQMGSEPSETHDENQEKPYVTIGNFLKSDQSLVMRNSRLKRFSEKYRDSVVRRLLSGAQTMTQIRREKDISEGELTDWIADLFARMQDRLETLEQQFDTRPDQRLLNQDETLPTQQNFPPGRTVEGKTKPK